MGTHSCFETGSLLLELILTHDSPIHTSSLLTYTTHVHRDAFSLHTATYTQATALPTLGTMFGKVSMTVCDNFPPQFWVIMQIYPIKEKNKGKRALNTWSYRPIATVFCVVCCLLFASQIHCSFQSTWPTVSPTLCLPNHVSLQTHHEGFTEFRMRGKE